jgi:hypothetical protein
MEMLSDTVCGDQTTLSGRRPQYIPPHPSSLNGSQYPFAPQRPSHSNRDLGFKAAELLVFSTEGSAVAKPIFGGGKCGVPSAGFSAK